VLRRAHAAESLATGADRIEAFRLTRTLIGGARDAGYSAPALARCLGITVSTLASRAQPDGWITAAAFAEIAGVRIDTVRRWHRQGRLPDPVHDHDGIRYRASDLVLALAGPPAAPRALIAEPR
jgi:DNA-binding transcriptional regulator YiaG